MLELLLAWRFIQNKRGEVVPSNGDDWNGEESVFSPIFYATHISDNFQYRRVSMFRQGENELALLGWFQLGEFRRFSVDDISDNGREMPALVGD